MINPVTFTNNTDDEDVLFAVESFIRQSDAEAPAVNDQQGWTPSIPSPSPFDISRNSMRVVPRVPIRLDNSQNDTPKKIDARSIRSSQIVSDIINDLAANGYLYKSSNGWVIALNPRRVAGSSSFAGELFFNTDVNRLAYKNADGTVTNY